MPDETTPRPWTAGELVERRNTVPPIGLGWGPQVGTLPRRANLPEQYAVFSPWGAPLAGPYFTRDEAQVGLILISQEA